MANQEHWHIPMVNQEHLQVLKQGKEPWSRWREQHPTIEPDLRRADLRGAALEGFYLSGADFSGADLREANLSEANLGWMDAPLMNGANLSGADLRGANLHRAWLLSADLSFSLLDGANLSEAILGHANLTEASLCEANLSSAGLTQADLSSADLSRAICTGAQLNWTNLERANLSGADLTGCLVVGARGRPTHREEARQFDLGLTFKTAFPAHPLISIDGLELAQLVFFLLYGKEMWNVVERLTSRIVLLLGYFVEREAPIANVVKSELRSQQYVPMTFDFAKARPETIRTWLPTILRFTRFVLADMTGAELLAQEVGRIVTAYRVVPLQPLVQMSAADESMMGELAAYPALLKVYRYEKVEDVQRDVKELIDRAEQKVKEVIGQ